MLKPTTGGVKASSPKQGTSVGSGSRPTTSKIAIGSSAPTEPHTLGRAPSGWLK